MTRTCGACHECCIHTPVRAFNKPADTPCLHLNVLQSCGACGIYDKRPSECRLYRCSWLEGYLSEALKPELSGVLLETARTEWPRPLVWLAGFEHKPGAIKKHLAELDQRRPGVIIAIVHFDGGGPSVFATGEDYATWVAFMENAQREGKVRHQYVDGIVEQEILE